MKDTRTGRNDALDTLAWELGNIGYSTCYKDLRVKVSSLGEYKIPLVAEKKGKRLSIGLQSQRVTGTAEEKILKHVVYLAQIAIGNATRRDGRPYRTTDTYFVWVGEPDAWKNHPSNDRYDAHLTHGSRVKIRSFAAFVTDLQSGAL